MNFTLGFYSFNVNLNDSSRGVYTSFRVKTPRHPLETLEYLYARIIAYAHSYEEELTFSQGLFEEKEPTIWKKNILDETEVWIQVGVPERKKIERALKQNPKGRFRMYFYAPEHVDAFCWMLRGSKSNWVEHISFYQINPELLEKLARHESSSSNWEISFIDSIMYLSVDSRDYSSEIQHIDIWDAFQVAIENHEERV